MNPETLIAVFLLPLAVQWWSTYYPGAEPGGGGYVVQRILAAKNEAHGVGACLFFNVMHYAVRPWPWIIVALASLIIYPDLEQLRTQFPDLPAHMIQHDLAYPAMLTRLPAGLLGIVVTSLIAAYMSTISTQLNYGSSILVNDVYRRFMKPGATESQLVWAGRLSTLGLMVASCVIALQLQDALSGFELLLQIGAGTGLLLILRWFWWRINAASEIVAMATSFLVAVGYFVLNKAGKAPAGWVQMISGVGITTAAWMVTAWMTQPTEKSVLRKFYRAIQPSGPGWAPVLADAQSEGVNLRNSTGGSDLGPALASAALATIGIWALIFAGGFTVYGRVPGAILLAAIALACGWGVKTLWPKLSMR